MIDKDFQLERVKFPLPHVEWIMDDKMQEEIKDTTYLKRINWRHNSFYTGHFEAIPVIYNNFEGEELTDTDERLFRWQGVENGIHVNYYFNRVDGKWYLTLEEDFSN